MGTPHQPRASSSADGREEVDFLDQSLPVLDDEEMEDLYRHFLLDDMPEEDDGDEDFEPPVVDEDEEGEEAGVRRRNIQARELNDLVQDAYKQLGTSAVSPGLRERVLDQLSMHFQLLVQTGVLASKAPSTYRDQETACVGMLEHLACGSGKHARRTRARGKATSIWWDLGGEDLTSVGIPGLLPCRTLRNDFTEAGRLCQARGDLQAAVERLMNSRGAVVWPQLLPNEMVMLGGAWPHLHRGGPSAAGATDDAEALSSPGGGGGGGRSGGGAAVASSTSTVFSMVEDRLLCRGIHLYGEEWDEIRTNFLPHKPAETLMRRYAVLSGWATAVRGPPPKAERVSPQGGTAVPWTQEEDLELRNAVQNHGKKWAHIAREVMPKRGRESLRNRWSVLEERLAVRTSSKGPPNTGVRTSDAGGSPPTTSSLMPAADRRARGRCKDGKHAGSSQAQPTGAQQGAGGSSTPFGVHPLSVMRALSLWPPYAAAGNPGQLAALSGQFAAAAAAAAAVGAAQKAPVTFPSVATGNRKPGNPAFGGSAGVLGQPAAAAAAAAAGRGRAGRAATAAAAAATRPRGQQARKRRMLGSSHPDGQWASGAYQGEAVPPGDEDEDEARHRGSAVASGSSENRIGSLPAHGETGTGAAPGVPDRAAYAEDELSDDPDGNNNSDVEVANQGAAASGCAQAANDRHEEESGAAAGSVSSRITREAPRYEEDELSDDDEDESDSL